MVKEDSNKLISPAAMAALMKGFKSRMLAVNTKIIDVDVDAYREYFDIWQESGDGLLMIRKSDTDELRAAKPQPPKTPPQYNLVR
jgi:hypothetical protein